MLRHARDVAGRWKQPIKHRRGFDRWQPGAWISLGWPHVSFIKKKARLPQTECLSRGRPMWIRIAEALLHIDQRH
eukprot:scaffold385_cov305-Pinguiococcus_pyrenoidosus.AAC.37